MPALYEQLGIRFEYPDNWVLDASEDQNSPASIAVASPSGAFWSVSIHPADEDLAEGVDNRILVGPLLPGKPFPGCEARPCGAQVGQRGAGG